MQSQAWLGIGSTSSGRFLLYLTMDFKQCGILTSVDSDEPLQPPFKLRNSKWCSVSSLTIIEYSKRLAKALIRLRVWGFAGRTYHIVGSLMHWLFLVCMQFVKNRMRSILCNTGTGPAPIEWHFCRIKWCCYVGLTPIFLSAETFQSLYIYFLGLLAFLYKFQYPFIPFLSASFITFRLDAGRLFCILCKSLHFEA